MSERPVTIEDLDCLNDWPKNTRGYVEEKMMMQVLLKMCEIHGYGRVTQVAAQIKEIWKDRENIKIFQQAKAEHFRFMYNDSKKLLEDNPNERLPTDLEMWKKNVELYGKELGVEPVKK